MAFRTRGLMTDDLTFDLVREGEAAKKGQS